MRRIFFCSMLLFSFLCTAVIPVSCTAKKHSVQEKKAQKKDLTSKILFVLGKDFSVYADLFASISAYYDASVLKENIRIISYADLTAKTRQPRLALIAEQLAAQPFDALISVGLPEGGAKILRTVKENNPTLHILSLLPVEEILPLEAYSSIVVDFELPDSLLESDRAVNIPVCDLQMLMLCSVITADQIRELPEQTPCERFSRALAVAGLWHTRQYSGKDRAVYTVRPYKDPELNIYSFNYLILSQESGSSGHVQESGSDE